MLFKLKYNSIGIVGFRLLNDECPRIDPTAGKLIRIEFTPPLRDGVKFAAPQFAHIMDSARAHSPYASAKLPLWRSGNLADRLSGPE